MVADPRLGRTVERGLRHGFSPPAVAALLRATGGPTVSHETIYKALYSSTFKGIGVLPRDCLRTRRKRRLRRDRKRSTGVSWALGRGFRLIDDRPEAARDRVEAGHWEGDLILGSRPSGSAIATLVERTSRLVLLAPLPTGSGSQELRDALIETLSQVPSHLRRSLTWDQGSEMHQWRDIERELDLTIFFCHPSSPWQRGSNENVNRQLRYWFPKGTHITAHPAAYFERVTSVLNNQPRRLLGWCSSAQRYGELAVL
jgi:IS30 family transposase